jgi:thiol-disulfide isomerase/thioredoxin
VQSKLIEYFPQSNLEKYLTDDELKTDPMEQQPAATKHKAVLGNYGQAPEFSGISAWLNSEPLTIQSLKGKVVLIDFWTYSCINCIRTLPYVTSWYEKYKDQGLVIVGVHTPEFEFEKVTDNVKTAIKRHKITYPVAQDNLFATWNNYSNRYWPAHYLIDKDGQVRYYHFGEGEYDKMEDAIIQLLEKPGMEEKLPNLSKETQKTGDVKTPEIYFGTSRLEYLTKSQKASLSENYTLPEKLEGNHFAMEGQWAFSTESAKLLKAGGKIKLKFYAGKIHMVAHSAEPVNLKITVDGKTQPDVLVSMSDLYTLFSSNDYAEHEIIIEIPESDFEAFTFTFG